MKKAVILISGGLDSATCLAIAKHQGFECYALSVDYGQFNAAELHAAKNIARGLGVVKHQIIKLPIGELGGSALTDSTIPIHDYIGDGKIPNTYVPARNTIFLSLALGWAEILNAFDIFIGVNAIDYSGYVDCRPEYIIAFQKMADLATKTGVEGNPIKINTPLIHLSKSDIISLGNKLGLDYALTVSCYRANEKGEACGKCDSCILRKKGFNQAGIKDPTHYIAN